MKTLMSILVALSLFISQATFAQPSTTQEIALLTYLKLKPGTEDQFMDAFKKIIIPSLSESGNIAWYVQQSDQDPTSIVFYTRWVNEEALQAHLKSQPLVEYIAQTAPLLEPGFPQLVRFHPIDQVKY